MKAITVEEIVLSLIICVIAVLWMTWFILSSRYQRTHCPDNTTKTMVSCDHE